jgi:hypothetical protein
MTDTDYLGFGDEAERRAAQGPAFVSHPPLGPRELIVAEQMHRKNDEEACNRMLFITVPDDGGEEVLEEPLVWQRIMRWPREPTIAEVQAFQLNARAARTARWWSKLAEAKALDDAEAAQPAPAVAVKPKGLPK